jgi:hypothetical protein
MTTKQISDNYSLEIINKKKSYKEVLIELENLVYDKDSLKISTKHKVEILVYIYENLQFHFTTTLSTTRSLNIDSFNDLVESTNNLLESQNLN